MFANDSHRPILKLAAIAVLASCQPSQAGEIVAINWFTGVGSVAGEFIAPLVSPNNDDVVGISPNRLVITQKDYQAIGPVDIELTVKDSGGTTEYFIDEGVSNGSGIAWTGYRLELGFGVGADFVLSPSGDDLDFDAPDFNSVADFSTFFSTVTETEDVLTASDGVFPYLAFTTPNFRFTVDVPDGIERFTIRQTPIGVPEPTTLGLAFLFGSLWTGRRHRQ